MPVSLQRAAIVFVCALLGVSVRADITLPGAASPHAESVALTIHRGEAILVPLRAHYGGGDLVTFEIVKRPRHGGLSDLRLLGDNRGSISYRNDNKPGIGEDSFQYLIKTGSGHISSPAEVRIAIEEPPPRIELPGRIDFEPIWAAQTASHPLVIRNAGGGVVQGRLTISAPWRLDRMQYSVTAGGAETLLVSFEPDEPRDFVGQITFIATDGVQNTVWLEGKARPPLTVAPPELRIAAESGSVNERSGSVSLTNRTDRRMRLKFEASSRFQPIDAVALEPNEKKEIAVSVVPAPSALVQEAIAIVGPGFRMSLPVSDERARSPHLPSSTPDAIPAQTTIAAALDAPAPATPVPATAAETIPPIPTTSTAEPLLAIHAQRLSRTDWELRWPLPREQVGHYVVEERALSLDRSDQLQISWRAVDSTQIRTENKTVVAKISGLGPKELHVVRVTAVAPNGSTALESPLVSLHPLESETHRKPEWLIGMAVVLVALLYWRWRVRRAPA